MSWGTHNYISSINIRPLARMVKCITSVSVLFAPPQDILEKHTLLFKTATSHTRETSRYPDEGIDVAGL